MTTSTTTPEATAQVPAPPRLRRRPAVLGIGLALVALGGLTAAWFATAVDSSTPVVVAAAPLLRGQIVTADQLTRTALELCATTATPVGAAGTVGPLLSSLLQAARVTIAVRPARPASVVFLANSFIVFASKE